MEVAIGIIVVFIIVIVLIAISSAHNSHYGVGDATVKFQTPSGTTVSAGRGNSLGEAVADGIRKLYQGLSMSSRQDTIESRLNAMEKTLFENRSRMYQKDISNCEYYISRTRSLLVAKKNEAENKAREKEASERLRYEKKAAEEEARKRTQREKELQRKRIAAQKEKAREEKRARAEAERIAKEKALPEHKRFVAEQRRLMTDSLRYEVLKRDGFRCQICGVTAADGYKLHVDHIVPVSKGGRTEMSNLRVLCERCNMGKRDKIEDVHTANVSTQTSSNKNKMDVSDDNDDTIEITQAMELLRKKNAKYVDKTPKGGALYFFDKNIAAELKRMGVRVSYTSRGTKGTNGRAAWYVK